VSTTLISMKMLKVLTVDEYLYQQCIYKLLCSDSIDVYALGKKIFWNVKGYSISEIYSAVALQALSSGREETCPSSSTATDRNPWLTNKGITCISLRSLATHTRQEQTECALQIHSVHRTSTRRFSYGRDSVMLLCRPQALHPHAQSWKKHNHSSV
jgi:hypothetical protein